jgi:hypothetical protein
MDALAGFFCLARQGGPSYTNAHRSLSGRRVAQIAQSLCVETHYHKMTMAIFKLVEVHRARQLTTRMHCQGNAAQRKTVMDAMFVHEMREDSLSCQSIR